MGGQNLIKHILVRHGKVQFMPLMHMHVQLEMLEFVLHFSPGATNLVTGIATAQMDSIPLVVVTGQVGRAFIGTDAFQETDIFGITLPIVNILCSS